VYVPVLLAPMMTPVAAARVVIVPALRCPQGTGPLAAKLPARQLPSGSFGCSGKRNGRGVLASNRDFHSSSDAASEPGYARRQEEQHGEPRRELVAKDKLSKTVTQL